MEYLKNFLNSAVIKKSFWAIILLVFFLLLPFLIKDPYILGILIMANIYAALAVGFDILLGYAGLTVLGYALFIGVGAYSSAFFNLYCGLPPWITIPIGGLVGASVGFLLGIVCLRLKGVYLALASFAAAAICEKVIVVFYSITGGHEGISGLAPISSSRMTDYYVSLILMLLFVSLLLILVSSKMGHIFNSIRDDQNAAEAVGIHTKKYKLWAFVIGSFIGGFWGSFMAHYMMHVGPEMFALSFVLTVVMITIVGGLGTIVGSLGGAYLLIFLNEMLRAIGEFRLIIYTCITIIVMLLLPQGIIPIFLKKFFNISETKASTLPAARNEVK